MDLVGLPTELEQFVQQEISEGKFATVEEVVSAALRLFREHEARNGDDQSAPNGAMAQGSQTQTSPEDIISDIKQAFETANPRLAERLAKEGAERYPEHTELQTYARVLAPPVVKTAPSTPESQTTVKADHAWLNANWETHQGRWIALKAGELLHVSDSLDDLIAHVGDVRGRNILVTKLI